MEHRNVFATDVRPGDLVCGQDTLGWDDVWMVISAQKDPDRRETVVMLLMCLGVSKHDSHGNDPFERWLSRAASTVMVVV